MNKKHQNSLIEISNKYVRVGLILIVSLIILASADSLKGFFGTLFNYGHLSESYQEMFRTSHDPDIRFGNFSPDGTKVVLNYRPMVDNEEGISYIGILEIATGKLQLIRPPEEYEMWYDGSFSPDGKEMVFSFLQQNEKLGLAIFDLSTLTHHILVTSDTARKNASFSPDGNRLLYFKVEYAQTKYGKKSRGNNVYEMDLTTKEENRLTNIRFGSGWAAPRYFPDGENYIFAAEFPYFGFDYTEENKERQRKHREQYKDNYTYIFNRNIMQIEAIPAIMHKDHSHFADMSQDGQKILCIAMNDLHKYNQNEKYNYELFMYENSQMRQLTDLQWMIEDTALTPDGTQAVFVADTTPSRGSERKVYLYDIDKNITKEIALKPENTIWLDSKEEMTR